MKRDTKISCRIGDVVFGFFSDKNKNSDSQPKVLNNIQISKNYKENLQNAKDYLQDSSDAVFREFTLGIDNIKCALVFIDGLASKEVLHEHIMIPLMQGVAQLEPPNQIDISKNNAYEVIKARILTIAEIKETSSFDKMLLYIMTGETALIIDGSSNILIVNTKGWEKRGIQEPETETIIRGPREGFTETIRVNTAQLRRKCRDTNMVIKAIQVGRRTKTDVAIAYIKGIVNPKIVEEVENRVNKIDTDEILETGQIEQFIEDSTWSPFPQIQSTERPDKAVSAMMEGRVVILVDGTPFALIVPSALNQFLQSSEDYYERWYIGTLLRILRWIGAFLALFTPALYIAVTSFHPGMLPTNLVIAISASRENLPFPAVIEALLMEVTIELLREAGARLPKPIGATIGIVGGIIIGDAAVRAGIASPILVIVVSVTAIASFVIPSYNAAITLRILRFPLMIAAAVLGLYGVILGFILITIHVVNLKSFGYSYGVPVIPALLGDLKDSVVRAPYRYMKKRPESTEPVDQYRQPKEDRGTQYE